jgi:hypothetical protein
MRRSLGGLMLIVAAVLVSVAAGSFWLQRVAFSPSSDSGVAHSVMGDEEIRELVSTIVAGATAPTLEQSPVQLRENIDTIARIPAGAALMRHFIGDAHARVIGELDERVLITAEEQVNIVRNERVADDDSITLPVQRVGPVAFLDQSIGWFALVTLGLGVLVALFGALLRPERGEGSFAVGVLFGSLSLSLVVFGYLVPLLLLPALSDDAWMGLFARLADHHRNLTLLLAAVALAIAAVIVFGTGNRRNRRQHSTPLNLGRYNDRGWSR